MRIERYKQCLLNTGVIFVLHVTLSFIFVNPISAIITTSSTLTVVDNTSASSVLDSTTEDEPKIRTNNNNNNDYDDNNQLHLMKSYLYQYMTQKIASDDNSNKHSNSRGNMEKIQYFKKSRLLQSTQTNMLSTLFSFIGLGFCIAFSPIYCSLIMLGGALIPIGIGFPFLCLAGIFMLPGLFFIFLASLGMSKDILLST